MIILACSSITLSFGVDKILDNISFNLQESDHIGIIGVNGAGKTTLFKIISGIMQPDSGDIFIMKGFKTGFLRQDSGLDSTRTIRDELALVYSSLIEMENRIKHLEHAISSEKEELRLSSLMKEYSLLSEKFSLSGGYEYNSKIRGVLRGLGFEEDQFNLKIRVLSGGQKTRLALAKLLLEEPDILLLDEPTNHLDISSIEWLEGFLKNYKKCVLVISHDRYFLDVVTNRTIELENCGSREYDGNYTEFMVKKSQDREIIQRHYDLQQKEIARMEAFIEQQKRWNREKNIIAAESRQKAADRIKRLEKPNDAPENIRIKFRNSIISGNDVLFVENIAREYPGRLLFKDICFNIKKNEAVFLSGPNGCGKSTLLKIIAGRLDKDCGNVEYGHNVKPGYYDQEQEDLNDGNTIIDEVWNYNEKLTQTDIRNALASFLFKGEDVFKPVSCLSGGEKSRIALLKLILSGANFLILDEPTNHLDIKSREILEQSLKDFDGTMLIVSHDRYFINKLATRILELEDGSLLDYTGSYSGFLEYKSKIKTNTRNNMAKPDVSASKLERLAVKDAKSQKRRLEKQLYDTEQEISKIEARLREVEVEMTSEELNTDYTAIVKLHDEQVSLKHRLDELYVLWDRLVST